jgi:hypothetical protein
MLQGIEGKKGVTRHIAARRIDAENAAFLMEFIISIHG